MNRTRLASSHEGKFTYWLDADRYVYQFNEYKREWCGWLCAQSSWESTFQYCDWMTLEAPTCAVCGGSKAVIEKAVMNGCKRVPCCEVTL